jgi:hypothetical protein
MLGAGAISAGSASAANFPVTNTSDAGGGSLRGAITSANGSAGPDTITFTGAGAAGTIDLLGVGLPPITEALDIQGPGASALTVDARGNSGIFSIGNIAAPDQPVTISGLRLVNADSSDSGGSIRNRPDGGNAAELTVANVVIANSYADGDGGAIYSDGGSLTVQGTTISRSNAGSKYDGGAVAVNNTDGDTPTEVAITGSRFSRNAAGESGGALHLGSADGDVSIVDSTFADSIAFDDGGAIAINGSSPTSAARIVSSTISGNESFGVGGGIDGSSVGESLVISDSTIAGNYADQGAGLYLYNGGDVPITLASSTVAGNTATRRGGGISRYGDPGDVLSITSSIVAANAAGDGAPDLYQYLAAGEPITVGNSLIGSVAGLTAPLTQSPAGTNKIDVDPQLGPLADNGGPTFTMAPALSSPAVDAGVANGLSSDGRGLPRTVIQPTVPLSPGSDGTDIGAVELAAVAPPGVDGAKVSAKKTQKQKGKKVVIKVKAGAAEAVTVTAKGSIKLGKKKIALKKVTKDAAAGKQVTLKLKPKGKSGSKQVLNALAAGKKAKAAPKVDLTDGDGNKATESLNIKLK